MASIEVERVEPGDDEILEEWVRVTEEEHILGVGATRLANVDWPWCVSISVAEYIRTEPLETKSRDAITEALNSIPGVVKAVQEDREVWVVKGDVSGEELVRGTAVALDRLAEATRAAYDQL